MQRLVTLRDIAVSVPVFQVRPEERSLAGWQASNVAV